MSANIILHTFNYINSNYTANSFTIPLKYITSVSNLLPTSTTNINYENISNLLQTDLNYLNITNNLYNLVITHPNYVASNGSLKSNTTVYSTTGSTSVVSTFSNITVDSGYNYIISTNDLYNLRDNISNNPRLTPSFISATNLIIYTKLLSLRNLIVVTNQSSSALNFGKIQNTGYFLPLYSIWSSNTIVSTASPRLITPITKYDFYFICFFCYLINKGIANLIADTSNLGVLEYYGLTVQTILTAYIAATGASIDTGTQTTIISNTIFNLYALQVRNIISYSINLLSNVQKIISSCGLPNYYILYSIFLITMLYKKDLMIIVSSLNITISATTLSFYPSGNISNTTNCILFSGISY
jgi:hypothetical protein